MKIITDHELELVKEGIPHERTDQTARRRNIFFCLNQALTKHGQVGEVVSIVVYSHGDQLILCYGHPIRPDQLFAALNVSTGIGVSQRPMIRLTSWREGIFVPLELFEEVVEDKWVALVNIKPYNEELSFPYKTTQPFKTK